MSITRKSVHLINHINNSNNNLIIISINAKYYVIKLTYITDKTNGKPIREGSYLRRIKTILKL